MSQPVVNGTSNGSTMFKIGQPKNRHLLVTPQLVWKTEQAAEGEEAQVSTPVNIAFLSQGSVVVSELTNRRLQVFDSQGRSKCMIGEDKVAPRGLAVVKEATGDVAVVDSDDKTVKLFRDFGEEEASWEAGMFGNPHALAITSRDYYVVTDTDPDSAKIHVCDGEGKIVREFGSSTAEKSDLQSPCSVTIDQHDRVIVTDYDNHCVKAFDKTGTLLQEFGTYGTKDGQLIHPTGVFVDYMDHIFVADNGNHRISLFSSAGNFIQHILSEEDGLMRPEAVAISNGSRLAVTENAEDVQGVRVYDM